jgi:hypothetical protein
LNWPSVHSELHLIYKITEFVMYEFNKQMEWWTDGWIHRDRILIYFL